MQCLLRDCIILVLSHHFVVFIFTRSLTLFVCCLVKQRHLPTGPRVPYGLVGNCVCIRRELQQGVCERALSPETLIAAEADLSAIAFAFFPSRITS